MNNQNNFAMSFPVLETEFPANVVCQGHIDYCAANGHATHTVDGVLQGFCPRCGTATIPASNNTVEKETKTMNTLDQHIEEYVNSNDNNVSYWVAGVLKEYATDYASLDDSASYDDVVAALNTLEDNVEGEFDSYREFVESCLESYETNIPNWLVIDYAQTWESNLRHDYAILGETYGGNGYYFIQH